MARPYAWEVDDSDTYGPWLCKDETAAESRRAAGKRVVTLYVDPYDLAMPTKQQRHDSERAQMILRDAEAMDALRQLRSLACAHEGLTLSGVVELIAKRLQVMA